VIPIVPVLPLREIQEATFPEFAVVWLLGVAALVVVAGGYMLWVLLRGIR